MDWETKFFEYLRVHNKGFKSIRHILQLYRTFLVESDFFDTDFFDNDFMEM
jgi:hypothetical protein